MKLLIITRGRVGNVRTLESIPSAWRKDTWLVCPPEEVELHAHQNIPFHHNNPNYSNKFQWILDRGCFPTEDKVVIIDDDLIFSRREGDKLVTLRDNDVEELADLWDDMEAHLEDVALCGVHPRQMGHQAKLPFVENTKIIAIQGVNRVYIDEARKQNPFHVDDFPILADVFLNCHLLRRGYGNRAITTYCQDHGPSQAPGGCSLYRTAEMQTEAVQAVARQFGPYAKAITKRPKSAKWLGETRTDLRVQWKELYKHAQANLG